MSKLTAIQTKALDTAVTDYGAFLDAGADYGASMRALAKALGVTPCYTALERLAEVHAKKYKCNHTTDNGRIVFFNGDESTRESRNSAALMSWRRNVMVWFTPTKTPKAPAKSMRVSKDVRALAEAYLANFESVTEAIKALRAVA